MDMSSLTQWFGQMLPQGAKKNDAVQSLISGQSAQGAVGQPNGDESNSGFAKVLARLTGAVTEPQAASERVVEQFARGAEGELHQSMMTLEKGDISFKFLMTAKNRLIDAYKEISRMA
jgi:flagellar hook-basal body complex protein FliE